MGKYVESEKVELKAKYTDTICKEIVAFLNADGGQIFIGIDDNGNVVKSFLWVTYVGEDGKNYRRKVPISQE